MGSNFSKKEDLQSVVKGNKAIFLDILIASINLRWCGEQTPEIRLGRILPRSGMK